MLDTCHVPFDLRNPLDKVLAHPESMVTGRRETVFEILNSEDVFPYSRRNIRKCAQNLEYIYQNRDRNRLMPGIHTESSAFERD